MSKNNLSPFGNTAYRRSADLFAGAKFLAFLSPGNPTLAKLEFRQNLRLQNFAR
jgi:hypothetical protein